MPTGIRLRVAGAAPLSARLAIDIAVQIDRGGRYTYGESALSLQRQGNKEDPIL